jgi:hypothetical protein
MIGVAAVQRDADRVLLHWQPRYPVSNVPEDRRLCVPVLRRVCRFQSRSSIGTGMPWRNRDASEP